jgi:exopolyphosphatase/guanosine-5'-triphosphate,3'-diphosphate pyrophosphatase
MKVARLVDDQFQVLDRLREMVRLAAGLDERNRLSDEARARGIACLERFGQRLRSVPSGNIRVVGTNTLRRARNGQRFLKQAERALAHPVEVISGLEEARLIYLGVAHSTVGVDGKRLVMDIGGGSTELILGEQFEGRRLESLFMGCVSMTQRFFGDGRITKKALHKAEMAARLELEPVRWEFTPDQWEVATGASGTIRSIRAAVQSAGAGMQGITREGLKRVRDAMIEAGSVDCLSDRLGISPERAPVFPGGFAILYGAFKSLGIERMGVSDGALREGLLYDLLGRLRHEDVRERTVLGLEQRYVIDTGHAGRVSNSALALYEQVGPLPGVSDSDCRNFLNWAAHLHELGLSVSHTQYHKHGAYLLHHADLAGFARGEQRLLAVLIRGHRRKFPKSAFKDLPGEIRGAAVCLCMLLRLAVLLHRGRIATRSPAPKLKVRNRTWTLAFDAGWLDAHPLTHTDLEEEARYLKAAGYKLRI